MTPDPGFPEFVAGYCAITAIYVGYLVSLVVRSSRARQRLRMLRAGSARGGA
jgi:hypothetical protein